MASYKFDIDFQVLRDMRDELNELYLKIGALEREYIEKIHDATGVWVDIWKGLSVQYGDDYDKAFKKYYDQLDRELRQFRKWAYTQSGLDSEQIALLLFTSEDSIKDDLDTLQWQTAAGDLNKNFDRFGKYWEIRRYWIKRRIYTIEAALEISDLEYMSLRGVGEKTARQLRAKLLELSRSEREASE